MEPPTPFTRRLKDEFGGRLRLRWSPRTAVWQLEEKVGRAALPPLRITEGDDSLVRARDGYAYVLSIAPGDRVPCPVCRTTLRLPHLTFHEVECPACKAEGRSGGRVRAAYFPLDGSALLSYLHKIDPLRGGHLEAVAEADADHARYTADKDARYQDGLHQTLFDAAIEQLPKVGYTTSTRLT
jgi:hypothetical protein